MVGTGRLDLLGRIAAVGPDVLEERAHGSCPRGPSLAQRKVREFPHNSAARAAATPGLRINFGKQIVGQGNHYLCHDLSIPGYTMLFQGCLPLAMDKT